MAAHRTRTATRDCTCPRRRPHGHQHTYQVHRCGCDDCRTAYAAYLREHEQTSAYTLVGPVRDHLLALTGAGWTLRRIAERTGWSVHTLTAVNRAARPRCRRDLAEDVLSIPLEVAA